MKASELIYKLNEVIDQDGDVEIQIYCGGVSGVYNVDGLSRIPDMSKAEGCVYMIGVMDEGE